MTGEFTLRSGAKSTEYFDKYLFESDPSILQAIATSLCRLIPPRTEILAGLEMGGIPIATMVSHYSNIPCLFVRKVAKQHGTSKLAEGQDFSGKQVTIVEDIVSSGGQIILSAKDLRDLGAEVTHALCVIDRQSGGKEKLAENHITLTSLFTMDNLKRHH
ncbi:MAG: orotate phosphoribosyltransferase [Pseudomonadales bacterium]|nr:orotate phosphoribosyltransferase [Pseudomonadales bacterium]MDP7314719.1 orotate phosphoribosyltransferase [Pseudomonadales bacterium]